jgi:hypothetical protein
MKGYLLNRSVLEGDEDEVRTLLIEYQAMSKGTTTHHPQSLPDNSVQQRKILKILVCQIPKGAIGVTKVSLLLLVQFLAVAASTSVASSYPWMQTRSATH